VDHLRQLVDADARVVRLAVLVLRAEVAPLVTVHLSQESEHSDTCNQLSSAALRVDAQSSRALDWHWSAAAARVV